MSGMTNVSRMQPQATPTSASRALPGAELCVAVDADPINPMWLFADLSPRLPEDVIVTADLGSAANWYARQLRSAAPCAVRCRGNLATMGPE